MLGDHFFSSLTSPQKPSPTELCANTTEGNLNQSLKEHLLGVSLHGSGVAATMPTLGRALGGYKGKALLKRARGRFRWQNEAAEKARSLRLAAQEHGAFVVNMASTGTGKTVANAKMAYALADPERGLRCTFAVGLNTLTLQMGEAYRSLLGVGSDTLALRVGDRGRRLLFEWDGAPLEDGGGEKTGSSSSAPLEDEGVVIYKGSTPDHPILSRLNPTAQGFVSAPLMVCTIDQISPATESLRGGHQIAPTLRLLTSDVVLDEPDDLQVSDMPALLRLAYWIGLWGSRLTLSSATMPPDFVEGLFHAYFEGRKVHAKNRGPSFKGVPCLWVDEEGTQSEVVPGRGAFRKAHDGFARKRAEHLSEKAPKCMAVVRPISDSTDIPGFILGQALELHERFRQRDPHTGTDVSFGVVRLDHIRQVRALAKALYARGMPEGHHLHLCVYHSRYPLISRSHIEKVLGSTLERHEPGAALKRVEPELRAHEADQHLFIVLGTSVVEVGQDHDYDWAITEPTSMRSFLQLLGRVRRHREYVATEPNVVILGQNIRSLDGGDGPFYWRPGFEKGGYRLDTVKAKELFRVAELQAPTSAPRIYYEEARTLQPNKYFSDLEHRRLRDRMLPIPLNAPNQKSLNGTAWYTQPAQDALLTGTLQRRQAFRKRHQPETIVRFTPAGRLQEFSREALRWGEYPWVGCKDKVDELEDPTSSSVTPWAHGSWQQQVEALSASRNLSIEEVCARFTQVRLPTNKSGSIRWEWHPNLGFDRLRP